MEAEDLANLREETKRLIVRYCVKNKVSYSKLASRAGMHPAQVLNYMSNKIGLTDSSLMKLGEIIKE